MGWGKLPLFGNVLFPNLTIMKNTDTNAIKLQPKQPISDLVDGMFINLEKEMDRVFESDLNSKLDTNLLKRIVHIHLSQSQDSLTVLSKILDAHQKGYLDNMLILTFGLTT